MANPFADPSVAGLDAEKQYTPGTVPDSFYEENLDVPPTSSLMGESNSSSETPAWLSDSSASASTPRFFPQGNMETMQPLNGPEEDNGEYDIEASPVESQSGAKKDPIAKVSALIKDIRTAPLPKLITYMRIANVGVATLMITAAVLTILADSAATLSTLVISLYVTCFGCLLCCFETHAKTVATTIAENFGFMYSARGRFAFLVLLSTLCFGLDLIGKITGILLCLTAILNLYVIVKFPEYESNTLQQDRDGKGPDSVSAFASGLASSYAASNPDAVRSVASTAAAWAANNPDVAAAAMTGAAANNSAASTASATV